MAWYQHQIELPAARRGCHLVTRHIVEGVPEIKRIRAGLLHLFLQHTSASLTINENADPDVRVDLESSLNAIVPESFPYQHVLEGSDDMPAHVKSSILGVSLSVPVSGGRLALGTWQGIYLCEHRNHGGRRRLIATLQGEDSLLSAAYPMQPGPYDMRSPTRTCHIKNGTVDRCTGNVVLVPSSPERFCQSPNC